MFSLYLSAAIIVALVGTFLSGPERIIDIRLLFLFLPTAVASGTALRFKRAVGIPVLVVVFVSTVYFFNGLWDWSCHSSNGEILRFRVVSVSQDVTKIEVLDGNRESQFLSLPGGGINLQIESLSAVDYYFFAAKPAYYRITGLGEYSSGTEQNAEQDGATPRLFSGIGATIARLPGWDLKQIGVGPIEVQELWTFSLVLENAESARLVLIRR